MTRRAPPRLILASASATRRRMLCDAGVTFETAPAGIDESAVRDSMAAEGAGAADMAAALAELKALRVSQREPDALVVGADQILALDGRRFDKPGGLAAARECLLALRGREHILDTAACAALGGAVVWRVRAKARLTVRDFSDGFLERYLAACGAEDFATVGAYRVESRGAQLLSRIEGDRFAILGLPLLELLEFLRGHGAAER